MTKEIINIKELLSNKENSEHRYELWGWLIDIWEKETDFKFGSENEFKKMLVKKADFWRPLIYEYNQWAQFETRNFCTVYSAVTELSFLFNREFSLTEILEIGNRMIKDWKLDPNYWAYLSDAIDYTRRWWNESFPENKVVSYQMDYTDIGLLTVLDDYIPRPTQLWYRTSTTLYNDTLDWIADKKTYPQTGGHAVTRMQWEIVNNYKREWKLNRFQFTYMQDLIKNGIVFQKWYIFLKQ